MKRMTSLLIGVFIFVFAACAPAPVPPTAIPAPTDTLPPAATERPTNTPVLEPPTYTPFPTFTPRATLAPIPTDSPFDFTNGIRKVSLDFTARLCEAVWMNGGEKDLPCPGDMNDPSHGYVGLLSGSDQGLDPAFAMVMLHPAMNSSGFGGAIFGRFPKLRISFNNIFKTAISCRSGAPCDFEFTLGYYDESGKYHEDDYPKVSYKQGDAPLNYVAKLGNLEGQTVELVLVVRSYNDTADNWALLLSPRLLR
jgi:hypothetical protein